MTDRPDSDAPRGERIAKIIARAGVCSRREAEVLIAAGRVELDGRTVEEPGTVVRPGQRVTVDGEALPALEPPRLFRLHKPAGILTATGDPDGRQTIYDLLPKELPRLMPVGRLDLNSEGLLLLTNDGGLKRHLELPATGWIRRYRVRAYGRPDPAALAALAEGVTVEGVRYDGIEATLERQVGGNAWMAFALREGKNREIRRVCEYLGLRVNRLIRTTYGPFQLGALGPAKLEEVPPKVLREQLGDKLALPGLAPLRLGGKAKVEKTAAERREGWAKPAARKPRPQRARRSDAETGSKGERADKGKRPGNREMPGKRELPGKGAMPGKAGARAPAGRTASPKPSASAPQGRKPGARDAAGYPPTGSPPKGARPDGQRQQGPRTQNPGPQNPGPQNRGPQRPRPQGPRKGGPRADRRR